MKLSLEVMHEQMPKPARRFRACSHSASRSSARQLEKTRRSEIVLQAPGVRRRVAKNLVERRRMSAISASAQIGQLLSRCDSVRPAWNTVELAPLRRSSRITWMTVRDGADDGDAPHRPCRMLVRQWKVWERLAIEALHALEARQGRKIERKPRQTG